MAAKPKPAPLDLDAISTDVAERFDAIQWKAFNSSDLALRNGVRTEVLDVRQELMKVAAADPVRAARIWDEHVPTYVPRPMEFPKAEPEPLVFNTIEPGRRRRKSAAEPYLDESLALGGDDINKRPQPPRADAPASMPARQLASAASTSVPGDGSDRRAERARLLMDGLDKQYLKADDKYHFRNKSGDIAFQVQDKKLVTQHETPAVVTSMIDLAEAQGWSSLKLTGTKEFRREAWLQANVRDIEVTGYQPTKLDKAKLDEIRVERIGAQPVNTISQNRERSGPATSRLPRFEPIGESGKAEPRLPLLSQQDQFLRAMEATMRHRGDAPEAIARARALGEERLTSERLHVGQLIDVGTAPYQDRRGEKASHYVTLEDDQGQRSKVWGVDLPRALEASGAQVGDKLALAFRGRRPVEVDVQLRDGRGNVSGTERQTVDRNTWEVVKFDRLRDEAKASLAKALDRQNNPAALKVFDVSAPSSVAKQPVSRQPARTIERPR